MPEDPPQGWQRARPMMGRQRSTAPPPQVSPPPAPTQPPGTTPWQIGVVPSQLGTGSTGQMPPLPTTPPVSQQQELAEIVAGQIVAIEAIAEGHPVYLVTLANGAKVVIKADGMAKSSVVPKNRNLTNQNAFTINELMGTVNRDSDNLPLTSAEFEAIAAFRLAPGDLAPWIAEVRRNENFMLKMKQVTGFTTFGMTMKRSTDLSDNDKAKFNNVIQKLRNNQSAWTSMGQVCLVDMFVGNGDRIWFGEGRIGNPGNMIFLTETDGTIRRALGYDTLDPNSGDMGVMYGTHGLEQWQNDYGKYIKDIRGYGRKCQSVINDLNQRWLAPLGIKGLEPNAASALAAGMEQGHNILARSISEKVRVGAKVPSGVMARARYLGWV